MKRLLNLRVAEPSEPRMYMRGFMMVAVLLIAIGQCMAGTIGDLADLAKLSNAESRSISPENPTGAKGGGARATEGTGKHAATDLGLGWKVSPSVKIAAHSTFTLADITGPGKIAHIWMTPTGNWKHEIIRFYWDGEDAPSVESPVGRLLRLRARAVRQSKLTAGVREPGQWFQLLLADAVS